MHTLGLVLLPFDTPCAREAIRILMAPFNSECETAPRKEFFDDSYMEHHMRSSGLADIDALRLWCERHGDGFVGVEEGRMYETTTMNPNGKWDYYLIGGCYPGQIASSVGTSMGQLRGWDDDICANLSTTASLLEEVIAGCVITPDGVWSDSADFGSTWRSPYGSDGQALVRWKAHLGRVLDNHPDHFIVGLDIHS